MDAPIFSGGSEQMWTTDIIDDLGLQFVWSVQRPGLVYIAAISSDTFLLASDIKFFEAEVSGKNLSLFSVCI
jgi:hypothetical protein